MCSVRPGCGSVRTPAEAQRHGFETPDQHFEEFAFGIRLAGSFRCSDAKAGLEPIFTLSSLVQLPVTPGAYSNGSPGPPVELMYIQRLSQAGNSIVWSAQYSGTGVACDSPTQCQQTNPYTQGTQILEDAQGDI